MLGGFPVQRVFIQKKLQTLVVVWALCAVGLIGGLVSCGVVLPSVDVSGSSSGLALPSSGGVYTVRVEAAGERISKVWLALHMGAADRYELTATTADTYTLDPTDAAVTEALRSGGGRGVAFVFAVFESGVKAASGPIPYTIEGVPTLAADIQNLPNSTADNTDPNAPIESLSLAGNTPVLRLPQRTTVALPGSRGQLSLSVGDISGGQIAEVVLRQNFKTHIDTRQNMTPNQRMEFYVGSTLYSITLDEITDTSIGGDFAAFTLREGVPPPSPEVPSASTNLPHETATPPAVVAPPTDPSDLATQNVIQRELLIQKVAESYDVTFIRNGESYSAEQAASFLRVKLNGLPPSMTLEEAISEHLTYSTESGQPYTVRFTDGRELLAANWLRALAAYLGQ